MSDLKPCPTYEESIHLRIVHDGRLHCIPIDDCPLCGHFTNVIEYTLDHVYLAECSSCGLCLGMPYGYSSRLDLSTDWNRRANEPKEETP